MRTAPVERLRSLGMRRWDPSLWLFPASWYDGIPEGFEVETITGERRCFRRGVDSRDHRFGFLAFGVRR